MVACGLLWQRVFFVEKCIIPAARACENLVSGKRRDDKKVIEAEGWK